MKEEQIKTLLAHEEATLSYWMAKVEEAAREVEIWKTQIEGTKALLSPNGGDVSGG